MGILVIAQPRDWQKQLGLLVGFLLLAGGVTVAASWLAGHLRQRADVWTADQFAQAIEQGVVERVILRGDEAMVETKAGTQALVDQEAKGIVDLLGSLDVPAEHLSRIEVVTEPASILPVQLGRWFWGIPIVILLLGIAGILRFRWGRQLPAR